MKQPEIVNVSDTARWIAAVRAYETMRSDRVFLDPLAERMAGYRGAMISSRLPWMARALTEGGIIARTALIDDYIRRSIEEGCDRVVNLAAGFDTRPYRLDIPPRLDWIEVDLPALIEEKNTLTSDYKPKCNLLRSPLDLADEPLRQDFIQSLGESTRKTLVITEGLLAYLTTSQVRALARDLASAPVAWWITDVYSKWAMRTLEFSVRGHLAKSPVSFHAPDNGLGFFADNGGWRSLELASELAEARRIRRLPAVLTPLGQPVGETPKRSGAGNWIAITRFSAPSPN
ncbi:class I SAM-dependent methyltransferase [Nocardia sp. NPDC058499]|uniref:class I SAM-dependent methyltransferase n=1 Tax=Nocardia sp. NPDC058499 TaxID=3346530 RepID=UPI00366426AB